MRIDPNAKYPLPDPNKLHRLLASESDPATAAIIRLAWQAGLTATEIANLRWADINYDDGTLAVSNRIIPASPNLIAFLSSMERDGSYVIYSNLSKGGSSTRNSVSHKARLALDRVGEEASLLDLRFDYIVRMLKEQPAEVVSRATGCEVRTLQGINKRYTRGNPNPVPRRIACHYNYSTDREHIETALKEEANVLDALIIMLSWMCDLYLKEMSELTWASVNLSNGVLTLRGKSIAMPQMLVNVLKSEKIAVHNSQYVLAGQKSSDKLSTFFISKRAAEFFTRHQLDGLSLGGIRGRYNMRSHLGVKDYILQAARQENGVSAEDVRTQFHINTTKAGRILNELLSQGELDCKNGSHYFIVSRQKGDWSKFVTAIITNLDSQSNVSSAALSDATGFSSDIIDHYIKYAQSSRILGEALDKMYHYTGKAKASSNREKFNDAIASTVDAQSNVSRAALIKATGLTSNYASYYIRRALKDGFLEELTPGLYHCTVKPSSTTNWDRFIDAITCNLNAQSNVSHKVLIEETGFSAVVMDYYIKAATESDILSDLGRTLYHYTGKE